ncbi:transglycosylase family protein [Streptomyces thermolineatus]|uniref:transglycosylase family protein n=1 Tax=Streptomyces thermolineatus TaxID=44033 RepID=UPI0038505E82
MLLSGNGRHRRPRQAPGFVVAAGATGAGVALPLLGAGAANAAPTEIWDQVAQCETGGDWGTNTGNGFYGGLQLSQATWEAYGGTDFAERADLADRAQQIAVAEKVLGDRGPTAWESCAVMAGLEAGGEPADVQQEAYEGHIVLTPGEGAESGSGGEDANEDLKKDLKKDGEKEKDAGGAGDGGPDGAPEAGAPGTGAPDSADGTPVDGRYADGADVAAGAAVGGRGAAEGGAAGAQGGPSLDAAGASEQERERAGGSAADGAAAGGAEAGAAGRSADAAPSGGSDGSYVVRPGDTLTRIADSQGVDGGWHGLYSANREALGEDPDLIIPGQELRFGN